MSTNAVDTSAASFFGWMGCASALVFANLGAAYGTAKGGVGLCSMGVMSPNLVMKNIIPIVMAGVLGIYGLIVAVIVHSKADAIPQITDANEAMNEGYKLFAAGLCCGLSSLGAGFAIGITGDAGVRAVGQQNQMYVGVILILIFGEALGLYGLIVSLVLSSS